jgi:metacaspase-1
MKKGLFVGINNYPDPANNLSGCVSDAKNWANALKQFGITPITLFDNDATKDNIVFELKELVENARAGDVIVFMYSGHGTRVFDTSGDEHDNFDEALYVYDGSLIDDRLRSIFDELEEGVHCVVILDSCFSGTATRMTNARGARVKFVWTDKVSPTARITGPGILKGDDIPEIVLTGCAEDELSYEVGSAGVFTTAALATLAPAMTYQEWLDALRLRIADRFPQTPQLDASLLNALSAVFEPSGTLPSEVQKPSWLKKLWRRIVDFFRRIF